MSALSVRKTLITNLVARQFGIARHPCFQVISEDAFHLEAETKGYVTFISPRQIILDRVCILRYNIHKSSNLKIELRTSKKCITMHLSQIGQVFILYFIPWHSCDLKNLIQNIQNFGHVNLETFMYFQNIMHFLKMLKSWSTW